MAAGSVQGWSFLGSCVELSGPLVDHITDDCRQQEITSDQFWEMLGMEALAKVNWAHGYDVMKWDIRKDTHVTYWTSRLPADHSEFPSRRVIFFDHSRIEYVWVKERS